MSAKITAVWCLSSPVVYTVQSPLTQFTFLSTNSNMDAECGVDVRFNVGSLLQFYNTWHWLLQTSLTRCLGEWKASFVRFAQKELNLQHVLQVYCLFFVYLVMKQNSVFYAIWNNCNKAKKCQCPDCIVNARVWFLTTMITTSVQFEEEIKRATTYQSQRPTKKVFNILSIHRHNTG